MVASLPFTCHPSSRHAYSRLKISGFEKVGWCNKVICHCNVPYITVIHLYRQLMFQQWRLSLVSIMAIELKETKYRNAILYMSDQACVTRSRDKANIHVAISSRPSSIHDKRETCKDFGLQEEGCSYDIKSRKRFSIIIHLTLISQCVCIACVWWNRVCLLQM